PRARDGGSGRGPTSGFGAWSRRAAASPRSPRDFSPGGTSPSGSSGRRDRRGPPGTPVIRAIDVASAFRAAWRHPRATRDELLAYQSARLRRLVAHAYRSVPYYRSLFDRHGVAPDRIRTAANLARIPAPSQSDLQRAAATDLVASGVDPAALLAHTTSGSSGEPLTVRSTWLEQRIGTAFRLRALRDFGMRAGDRRVEIGLL